MGQKSREQKQNLWPNSLSDEEFAALLKRVKAASPQFTQGLAALIERVGQEIAKEKQHEAQV
jgi:hypothetical protein